MKGITTSQKIFIAAVVSLVASGLFYWGLEQAIDHKEVAFEEARDARARARYEAENRERAQQLVDTTSGTLSVLEQRLLSIDEPLEFLALVDDTIPHIAGAPTRVVSISKEEVRDKESDKSSSYVRVVLNAQGNWENLFHLLLLIEHLPYAVSLDRAVLELSGTRGEYAWEANLFLSGGIKE